MEAPRPADERERQEALDEYEILDTGEDPAFDRITELAAYICGTPISLITLVDRERQWFKSHYGLDVREATREHGFCPHTILQEGIFEISDASEDERFHDNPFVAGEPNIRFYAGVPLTTADGRKIGSLCTVDRQPKHLNDQQKRALETLSFQVVKMLELRRERKRAETLLRELRHRVSNSYQVVEGLAYLHRDDPDISPKEALDRLADRISSLSAVHRHLYSSSQQASIAVEPFLETLLGDIRTMYEPLKPDVKVSYEGAPLRLRSDDAVSLALVMSELVSNAYKHAFPGDDSRSVVNEAKKRGGSVKEIAVRLSHTDSESYLEVSDNGVGMGASAPREGSLGMQISESLAQQLGAELESVSSASGTTHLLRFTPVKLERDQW